ncbi:uncharacterized protein JCM15063_002129 [Sporobolomyces koalae]|uniref:uncharacterized protein n=1 Tax=Sporobolomyces koalae TaxID=500713 RepID=UPI0031762C40
MPRPITAVAPTYLRTQSSPTLAQKQLAPSPTSSTFIGVPMRPKPRPRLVESNRSKLFREQAVPVLVVDEQLTIREMNRSARRVFGLESSPSSSRAAADSSKPAPDPRENDDNAAVSLNLPSGCATFFFAAADPQGESTEEEQVRREIVRLADLCETRERQGTWGQGERALLLKEGRVWAAEVFVRRFEALDSDPSEPPPPPPSLFPDWVDTTTTSSTLPQGSQSAPATPTNDRHDWYEVTLLRPWQDRPELVPSLSARGPIKTQDVLDRVPHVRQEVSVASLPNPHLAAPDIDPSVLPKLVSASSSSTLTNGLDSSGHPEAPMRRKDSYYSDRTPTLGSAYTTGNLFQNSWGMNQQRSGSSSGRTATATTPSTGGGSWEYAQPFGSTIEEDEHHQQQQQQQSSTDSPQPSSPHPVDSELQDRRHDYSIRAQDHHDPPAAPPVSNAHLRLTPSAFAAENRQLSPTDSTQPNSGGTDPGMSSRGSSTQGNSRDSSPGGTKAKLSPTAAAALRPGGPSPLTSGPMQGMGISVSSAGIQLTQSTPAGETRSKSAPVASAAHSTSPLTIPTTTTLPPSSPSLATPTSGSSPPMSTSPQRTTRIARPHPLSFSRTTLSDSSNASMSSNETAASFPLGSPRPTALPPVPPKSPDPKPDPTSLLQFSTLANLPKTGVIIADPEVASGYVNALARELLMGVPAVDPATPNSPMADDLPETWWNFGHWSLEDEPWSSVSGASGSVNSSTSGPFFSGVASPAAVERQNPFEAKDLMYSAIIAAGEATDVEKGKGTAGTGLRIGKPVESNRFRTTVAGILARSLVGTEKRKIALRGEKVTPSGPGVPGSSSRTSPSSSSSAAAPTANLGGFRSPGGHSNGSGSASGSSRTSSSTQIPAFIAAGGVGAQGRKPYKVFDQSFSQRVIDPFEPLLEMCARRGEQAPIMDPEEEDEYDRATNGMIVGIEVEVWEAAADSKSAAEKSEIKANSFVTSNVPSMQYRSKKRVRRRIIEVTAAPLFAPSKQGTKQHLGGVLLLRDITDDQRRLGIRDAPVLSLKKSKKGSGETYFKQILDNMPQMVWTTTPRGSHSYFNKLWYEYTGLEPEQSLGLGWQSPFHEDDMPAAMKAWSRSLETGEPYSVEYRCRRYDGTWRWMLGRALPFRDADGKIQGWFGTCTDFDELYKMREQLERTLQQNAAVVTGASCLLLALDREGIITYLQGAQKAALIADAGLDREPEGLHISAIKPTEEFLEVYRRVIDGETTNRTLTWMTSKNGLCFRCLLTPLLEARPDDETPLVTGCIVVAHDITDLVTTQTRLKQSYEERAKLQASETAATEASRLKSEFLALTSHELRTPIAHMLGLSELLLAEPLSESQKSLAAQILRSGDVLLEMIGQVLDMGKVEAGKLDLENRPFNLNDLSSDARLFSTAASKKGLQFVEEIDKFSTEVLGDMPRLRQVLTNLLSNAVKFTKKGAITLRVKILAEDESSIKVRWEVQDTGVGIKREAISSLFKPFHQADVSTSRQFGGTGLGLSISKNLIELMGGSISLTSDYGVGTKMTVELRLQKASEACLSQASSAVPKAVQDVSEVIKDNTWILVVDDNELNRSIIARLLSKMGFHVDCAGNGWDALDMVADKRYDLVLMDHQMDGIDGLETTVKMRQSSNPNVSSLKIIALTASALKGDQEKFLASGADGYLSKPVRSAVLEATILKALAPQAIERQSSTANTPNDSNTPNEESASRSGFDFGSHSFGPSQPPAHTDDTVNVPVRRRPSYPMYSSEAAL